MITGYEAFTDYPVGLSILPADCAVAQTFELGHAVQTLDGLNGMLTEVADDFLEGVIDIGAAQVWNQPVLTAVANYEVGAPVYFDPATGALTMVAAALSVYGKLVRASLDDVFPVVGAASIVTLTVAVTN